MAGDRSLTAGLTQAKQPKVIKGHKGKPSETGKGAGGDKGKSNGSGDKKGPGESNGKNRVRPDQDGTGADHGVVNDDKQWDGNNGCGNDKQDPDSPFEDDNNGKCKGLKKGKDEGGAAFETTVIAEDWHMVCWDASPGSVWYVLAWNAETGHSGPVYRVEVTESATGAVDILNPFNGTIVVSGVIVTRMNPDTIEAEAINPL